MAKTKRPAHYYRWLGMRRRCFSKKSPDYPNYGGRGITICPEWLVFETFQSWCLDTFVSGRSLDRMDNDGPYSPDNCRWATQKEQANNARHNTPRVRRRLREMWRRRDEDRAARFGDPLTRTEKKCSTCKQVFSNGNFTKNCTNKDGLSSDCRECNKIFQKRYKARKKREKAAQI